MATGGTQLPLDPSIVQGIADFNAAKDTFIRQVTVLVLHVAALLWASRLFAANHRGRRIMVGAALLSAIAPIADTLENLASYVMLADPAGFPDSLALLYSSCLM